MPIWERYNDYEMLEGSVDLSWSQHLIMCIKHYREAHVVEILRNNEHINEIDLDHQSEGGNDAGSTLAILTVKQYCWAMHSIIELLVAHGTDLTKQNYAQDSIGLLAILCNDEKLA